MRSATPCSQKKRTEPVLDGAGGGASGTSFVAAAPCRAGFASLPGRTVASFGSDGSGRAASTSCLAGGSARTGLNSSIGAGPGRTGLSSLIGGGSGRMGLSSLTGGGSGRVGLSSLIGAGSGRAAAAGGVAGGSSARLFTLSDSAGTPHLLRGVLGAPAAFPPGGVGGGVGRAAAGEGGGFTGTGSG